MHKPLLSTEKCGKVLLLGDDARSFLAVVRSLGRKQIEVHVVPIARGSPALASRYISAFHPLPHYEGAGARWIEETRLLLDREQFDLVIPLDDRSLIPFHLHRHEFARHRIAIPNEKAFEVTFSKNGTRALAQSLGIPVARGRLSASGENAESLISEFGLPVILKPVSSFSVEQLYEKSIVRRATTLESLEHYLDTEFKESPFVIEAAFSGVGLGMSVLAQDGAILQAFEHHRIHEPPGGGGSSYRVSAPLQADLLDACGKFIAALSYTGVAMFEFKQDAQTQDWILLEVNGRFWGSLPLAVSSGVDFPYLLYSLLVCGKPHEQPFYRYGLYSRSLGDDYWYYRALIGDSVGYQRFRLLFQEITRDFKHLCHGVERVDTLALDDLRPAYRDLKHVIAQPCNRILRSVLRRARPFHALQLRRLKRALAGIDAKAEMHVVFVCQGNICRSPFAEAVARMVMNNTVASSAGTRPLLGRYPPPQAVETAANLGLDVTRHRSRIVDYDTLASGNLIFAFDLENYNFLRVNYPEFRKRLFFLGACSGGASCEIADPYGGADHVFEQCFVRIKRAVEELARAVGRFRGAATTSDNHKLKSDLSSCMSSTLSATSSASSAD